MHIAPAPGWASWVVFVDAAVVLVAAMAGLLAAQRRRNGGVVVSEGAAAAISVALIAWFAIALALGNAHVFRSNLHGVPWIGFGVGLPIVVGLLVYAAQPSVRRAVQAIPQPWLLLAQAPRIVGGLFLLLMLKHRLPHVFALPAGIGDIFIGVTAPFVALAYAARSKHARAIASVFNGLGILDLVIAVGTGFLTSPSPFQLFHSQPSTALMTIVPLVLVPTFLVPFWILVHAASIRGLRAEARVPGVARSGWRPTGLRPSG